MFEWLKLIWKFHSLHSTVWAISSLCCVSCCVGDWYRRLPADLVWSCNELWLLSHMKAKWLKELCHNFPHRKYSEGSKWLNSNAELGDSLQHWLPDSASKSIIFIYSWHVQCLRGLNWVIESFSNGSITDSSDVKLPLYHHDCQSVRRRWGGPYSWHRIRFGFKKLSFPK